MQTNKKCRGFTLIEILVVLVIVAIITAVAVLAFGHFGRSRREKIIVNQLVRVIPVAQQQAILTPLVLGLGINHNGYQFYEYLPATHSHAAKWISLQSDVLSNSKAFHSVFIATVVHIEGYAEKNANSISKPAIVFLPSGSVTPFTLHLNGYRHQFTITVKNNGAVTQVENDHETT